ncbi:MAG: hypothetical protein RL219_472 [Actinomycetota bacterium]
MITATPSNESMSTSSSRRKHGHPNWAVVAAVAVVVVAIMLALTARHDTPKLNIDRGAFRMPTPPVDAKYSGGNTLASIIWLGVVALVGFGLAIRDFARTRLPLAMFVTISAPMIIFPEVFVDVMGAVWYPLSESDNVFTILGRQMGTFIIAGWFGFGSLFMYTIYKVFERGLSTRGIWLAFLAAGIGSIVFEEILQNLGGMYLYYGNQPLIVLWKLPWWWMPCNAGGVFLAAAIAYRLRDSLRGWRGLAMLVITPASMGGVYGFIALPSWIVVNGKYNWWVTQLGGVATLVLGVVCVALIIRLVLNRDPWDLSGDAPQRVSGQDYVPGTVK